jgi:hypothetical protein
LFARIGSEPFKNDLEGSKIDPEGTEIAIEDGKIGFKGGTIDFESPQMTLSATKSVVIVPKPARTPMPNGFAPAPSSFYLPSPRRLNHDRNLDPSR